MGGFQVAVLLLQPLSRGACGSPLHGSAQPSCQRKVGASPNGQCQGVPTAGMETVGRGGAGREGGAGQHRGYFCNAVVRTDRSGMLLSYCCQRDVKFIVAFGVWVGTCFEFVFCLFI